MTENTRKIIAYSECIMDNYAKNGGSGVALLLCSFDNDLLPVYGKRSQLCKFKPHEFQVMCRKS